MRAIALRTAVQALQHKPVLSAALLHHTRKFSSTTNTNTNTNTNIISKNKMGDAGKKAAARRAVDEHVKDGMVIGLGTGSTVVFVAQRLGELVREHGWKLVCVPTSFQSRELIVSNGLSLSSLDMHPSLDVAIDGCDECDSKLNLIKGGGGALMQEKIVAFFAKKFVVVADSSKKSDVLGTSWKSGIPVEISSTAHTPITNHLKSLNLHPTLRMAVRKAGPVVTDNGNFILDVQCGEIVDPLATAQLIGGVPGVLEHGLFCGMASCVYFGNADGSVTVI